MTYRDKVLCTYSVEYYSTYRSTRLVFKKIIVTELKIHFQLGVFDSPAVPIFVSLTHAVRRRIALVFFTVPPIVGESRGSSSIAVLITEKHVNRIALPSSA